MAAVLLLCGVAPRSESNRGIFLSGNGGFEPCGDVSQEKGEEEADQKWSKPFSLLVLGVQTQ